MKNRKVDDWDLFNLHDRLCSWHFLNLSPFLFNLLFFKLPQFFINKYLPPTALSCDRVHHSSDFEDLLLDPMTEEWCRFLGQTFNEDDVTNVCFDVTLLRPIMCSGVEVLKAKIGNREMIKESTQ